MQNGLCSFISDTNGLVLIIYNTSQCIGKCAATYFVEVMKSLKQQTTVQLWHPVGTVGRDHCRGAEGGHVRFNLFVVWKQPHPQVLFLFPLADRTDTSGANKS